MAALSRRALRGAAPGASALSIADLVLLRVVAGGGTRAELQRDLAVLVAPKVSGTEFRRSAELAIGIHTGRLLLNDIKGRLTATQLGMRAAEALIAPSKLANPSVKVLLPLLLKRRGLLELLPNKEPS